MKLEVIYQGFKQYPKAIKVFEQALSLNSRLELAYFYIREFYDEFGLGQKVIFHLRLAENLSRQNQNQVLQNKA
jgi:tetratricopeptide (TPR) repeat protein